MTDEGGPAIAAVRLVYELCYIFIYMASNAKKRTPPNASRQFRDKDLHRPTRERVLLEFPSTLLRRADEAAAEIDTSRSELVRTAVEQFLGGMEKERLEAELAEAYAANAALNLELTEEFAHVDREGL